MGANALERGNSDLMRKDSCIPGKKNSQGEDTREDDTNLMMENLCILRKTDVQEKDIREDSTGLPQLPNPSPNGFLTS